MKLIKKLLKWSFWLVGVLLIGLVISTLLFRDRIVSEVVKEFNKYIDTPVAVKKVDFNIWENFPTTSITFYDINIKGSKPDSELSLLEAEKIIITLNPLSLLRNEYEVNSAIIRDAQIFIDIDKNGRNNFSILKKPNISTSDSTNTNLEWSLSKVTIINSSLKIHDNTQRLEQEFEIPENILSLNSQDKLLEIFSEGNVHINYIKTSGSNLISNINTAIKSKIIVENDILKIHDSSIKVNSTTLSVSGHIGLGNERQIALEIGSQESNLQNLTGLIPIKNREILEQYQFDGFAEFGISINGRISSSHSPKLEAKYLIRNGYINYKEKGLSLEKINASGSLVLLRINDISSAFIDFQDFNSIMNGEEIKGNISLKNLIDPTLYANLVGTVELEYLSPFILNDQLKEIKGTVSGDLQTKGRVQDIKNGKSQISGNLIANSIIANHSLFKESINITKGQFSLKNNNLKFSEAEIRIGNNVVKSNGEIREIFDLISGSGNYDFDARVASTNMDLDQLLSILNSKSSQESSFAVNKSLNTELIISFDALNYKKFKGRSIQTSIDIKNGRVVFRNLKFKSGGGDLDLYGYIETNQKFEINARGQIKGLFLDSLFYTFNNFNQSWLVEDNLEGQIYADILTVFELDGKMNLIPNSLTADANASIRKGELNDFEPMISLGKYIKDDNLANLKFSDIQNNIHIENGTIYLPEMEVNSNVSTIQISGTHGFSTDVNYSLVIPLNTLTRLRNNEDAFGAVEDDGSGSKLFLKITGTTSDYKIQYDKQAVKSKIVADLKGEVQELKNAFKKKEREKVESIELSEDEYFEWETDTLKNYKY